MKSEIKSIKEQIGDILVDIGKMTFAGVVLSAVLQVSSNKSLILIYGIVSTLLLIISGIALINLKNSKS